VGGTYFLHTQDRSTDSLVVILVKENHVDSSKAKLKTYPEDEDNMLLRNTGKHLTYYIISQSTNPFTAEKTRNIFQYGCFPHTPHHREEMTV
jgi:hypothetical protein